MQARVSGPYQPMRTLTLLPLQASLGEGARGYSRPDGVAGELRRRCLRVRSDTSPDEPLSANDILFVRGTRDATQLARCCATTRWMCKYVMYSRITEVFVRLVTDGTVECRLRSRTGNVSLNIVLDEWPIRWSIAHIEETE